MPQHRICSNSKTYTIMNITTRPPRPNIVDPTMSIDEVKEHLKATVFSSENIIPSSVIIKGNFLKYKKQYVFWLTEENDGEYFKIYSKLDYSGRHTLPLNVIPYWHRNGSKPNAIYFCTFHHRAFEYVAHFIEGEVQLYSMHAVRRYIQRFLGVSPYMMPTYKMIGEMFLYNSVSQISTYHFNGCNYNYEIVRDGIFNCERTDDTMVRTTFLSREMLKNSQVVFYNKNIHNLNGLMVAHGQSLVPRIVDDRYNMAA